jgi:hypothetical protein
MSIERATLPAHKEYVTSPRSLVVHGLEPHGAQAEIPRGTVCFFIQQS